MNLGAKFLLVYSAGYGLVVLAMIAGFLLAERGDVSLRGRRMEFLSAFLAIGFLWPLCIAAVMLAAVGVYEKRERREP